MAEKNYPTRLPETEDGPEIYSLPFPKDTGALKGMAPIVFKQPYSIEYIHSYGQDSAWFAALSNGVLLGNYCPKCKNKYPTPRGHCADCGEETEWVRLPKKGKVHTFTVCHFGSEEFLDECPFILAQIEFRGCETLLLTRLLGVDPLKPSLKWVGMEVEAKFRRLSKLKPTDIYFVPAQTP